MMPARPQRDGQQAFCSALHSSLQSLLLRVAAACSAFALHHTVIHWHGVTGCVS